MTAPSRRLPRSVLWALGLFAGTTAAVILSASSASASPEPPGEHLLPATIGAVTDTVTPVREQVVRPTLQPVTDKVLRPTLKPVADKVLRPALKPVTDKILRPALKPVTDKILRPALKPVTDKILRPALEPVAERILRPVTDRLVQPPAARPAIVASTSSLDKAVPTPQPPAAKASPKATGPAPKHLAPSEPHARSAATKSSLSDKVRLVSGAGAPAYAIPAFAIPQPADHSPAPHWPSPAAPSAPTQVLSGGSGSMIAKKFAVLGGIAPQQFAVTGRVTTDADLIGPAPGERPGTTPD
ncbi:hypothetical protein [Kribbella sp. DT2]|uniref:hypothetical protein n=1 Tax=Kribbella sp. DT2 TaxID=3393427 RepID=UPI003CE6C628